MRGSSRGFTLIEIIVAVALVAILSAAIAPSVINNIAQGRVARAQSDVQTIAQAVARFRGDTGKYPRLATATAPDTAGNQIDFLATGTGGNDNWPVQVTGAEWPAVFTSAVEVNTGSCQEFERHLIRGLSHAAGADSMYTRVDPAQMDDPNAIGFRGQLMNSDPTDPWGNKYICNVAALGNPGVPVWVVSAGPNGMLETTMPDSGSIGASASLVGDDIGFRVQ